MCALYRRYGYMRVFVGIGIAGGWLPTYILDHEYVDRINLWRHVTYMRLCMYVLVSASVIRYCCYTLYALIRIYCCWRFSVSLNRISFVCLIACAIRRLTGDEAPVTSLPRCHQAAGVPGPSPGINDDLIPTRGAGSGCGETDDQECSATYKSDHLDNTGQLLRQCCPSAPEQA